MVVFDPTISLGTILTIFAMIVGGIFAVAQVVFQLKQLAARLTSLEKWVAHIEAQNLLPVGQRRRWRGSPADE